jgi:hypothetical protein
MLIYKDGEGTRPEKRYVKSLLERRLRELHRHESRLHGALLKSFYASQEAVLEEILHRARGHTDDETLILLIDQSIQEGLCYQKLSTDHGMKSLYGIKVRVLRATRVFLSKYLRVKNWSRKTRRL